MRRTLWFYFLAISFVVALVLPVGAAHGLETNRWLGTIGPLWDEPSNWSAGKVPDATHAVVIPPNSGTIKTDGGKKIVGSLDIQTSNFPGTKLTTLGLGLGGKDVEITAMGDIHIGARNYVTGGDAVSGVGGEAILRSGGDVMNEGVIEGGKGEDGVAPGPGGRVVIEAPNGTVTNTLDGLLRGGTGGNAAVGALSGAPGGAIKVSGMTINNLGTQRAGGGGAGGGGATGGNGGNITNEATGILNSGNQFLDADEFGIPIPGPGGVRGSPGKATNKGAQGALLPPGRKLNAGVVVFTTQPGGYISMPGILPGTLHAITRICISGFGAPIDLTGISAGTIVMSTDAGGSIQIQGPVVMDPGVTLADIADPDPLPFIDNECLLEIGVVVGGVTGLLDSPDAQVASQQPGTTSDLPATPALAAGGFAALAVVGWYARRRFSRN